MTSTCKYCGKPIEWDRNASGKTVPYDRDGTPHHRTCRKYHQLKARRTRELKAAYGPSPMPVLPEDPNQLHFSF